MNINIEYLDSHVFPGKDNFAQTSMSVIAIMEDVYQIPFASTLRDLLNVDNASEDSLVIKKLDALIDLEFALMVK